MSVLNSQMIPTVAQASNSPLKGDAMMSAESERTDENLRRHHAKIWTTWTDEGETVICICGTRYVFSRKNGSSSLLKHSKKCLDTLAYYKNRNESFPFNTVDLDDSTTPSSKKKSRRTSDTPHRHFLSIHDMSMKFIGDLLDNADSMMKLVKNSGGDDRLKHKILGSIFYEPSTRTSCSFQAAMLRLGGSVISINQQQSSIQKGETLEDTIQTVASYCDVIVLRHPEKGSAAIAAGISSKPVINAGDGIGEHPTQALLDIYTIKRELGEIGAKRGRIPMTVTFLGDLKNGRTVHSLALLLAKFSGVRFIFCAPPQLALPEDIMLELRTNHDEAALGLEYRSLDSAIAETDVLYVTRIQKERFPNEATYRQVQGTYCINKAVMAKAKKKMIVMHPLPRVDEIAIEVDSDPRAAYFRQMENGMYVRMALLDALLNPQGQAPKPTSSNVSVAPTAAQSQKVTKFAMPTISAVGFGLSSIAPTIIVPPGKGASLGLISSSSSSSSSNIVNNGNSSNISSGSNMNSLYLG